VYPEEQKKGFPQTSGKSEKAATKGLEV